MDADLDTGSVEGRHYTHGRRPPITISKLGPISFMWGRQDAMVYIVAIPLLVLSVATVGLWWPLVAAATNGPTTLIVTVALMVGLPSAAAMAASAAGLKARDLPRYVRNITGSLALGTRSVYGDADVRPEPSLRISGAAAHTWLIPTDAAALEPHRPTDHGD